MAKEGCQNLNLPQFPPSTEWRPHFRGETFNLRELSPSYMCQLLGNGELEFFGIHSSEDLAAARIIALPGGTRSAAYLVSQSERSVLVKFTIEPIEHTILLKHLGEQGVDVPRVYKTGVIDETNGINYTIMEGLTVNGELAPTVYDYMKDHPEVIEDLGTLAGKQLANIHGIQRGTRYGNLDAHSFDSWADYLTDRITFNTLPSEFQSIPAKDLQAVIRRIHEIEFTHEAIQLHGDFNKSNLLITSVDPLEIKVIDARNMVGDPYWDIADQVLRLERSRLRSEYLRNDQEYQIGFAYTQALLKKYFTEMGISQLNLDRLNAHLVVQAINKLKSYANEDASFIYSSPKVTKQFTMEVAILQQILQESTNFLLQEHR